MSGTETVATGTISDFLLARIAEDEDVARATEWRDGALYSVYSYLRPRDGAHVDRHDPNRVLAECEAKRRIVEFHRNWPVLLEKPVEFDPAFGADLSLVDQLTYRASKQIAWMTEQEYRDRFGDEPPTAPMLAALAVVYADHPDYREEWRP